MKELVAIQRDLRCKKSRENKFGGYKYRSCEDIMEAVKPLLAKNECTLIVGDEVVAVGSRVYIKSTASLRNKEGDLVEVSAYAREEETKKGMDVAQITGAASSYARKYALNGLFCIDDGQDPDAMDNREMGGKKRNGKGTEEEQLMQHIQNASSVSDLQILWESCDTSLRTQLAPAFGKRKLELQNGTTQH